jgi:6-pyruvoyltetrahydropterin/6-carboxytetrahydropterin synthase
MPRVTVTRRLNFNAAHRLHNPALSEQENHELFGLCNSPNWHGHNYRLDVSVAGEVDERTGYVIDLKILRDLVEAHLIDKMDHKNLNVDVDFLHAVNPTAENIVVACWRVLEPAVKPAALTKLRLWETDNNYVEYEGE